MDCADSLGNPCLAFLFSSSFEPHFTAAFADFCLQNPKKKYNLEYYLNLVERIIKIGTHSLGIKDMVDNPFSYV
jgi:hypothetical protein